MDLYTRKPKAVYAVQWNGDKLSEVPKWISDALHAGFGKLNSIMRYYNEIWVETIKGKQTAMPGDYIIKDEHENIYACSKDVFESEYELFKP